MIPSPFSCGITGHCPTHKDQCSTCILRKIATCIVSIPNKNPALVYASTRMFALTGGLYDIFPMDLPKENSVLFVEMLVAALLILTCQSPQSDE